MSDGCAGFPQLDSFGLARPPGRTSRDIVSCFLFLHFDHPPRMNRQALFFSLAIFGAATSTPIPRHLVHVCEPSRLMQVKKNHLGRGCSAEWACDQGITKTWCLGCYPTPVRDDGGTDNDGVAPGKSQSQFHRVDWPALLCCARRQHWQTLLRRKFSSAAVRKTASLSGPCSDPDRAVVVP